LLLDGRFFLLAFTLPPCLLSKGSFSERPLCLRFRGFVASLCAFPLSPFLLRK
jgi:hypothetical protein